MMSECVVTQYEEDPTRVVDLEGRHIHKSDVSCDQHRLAENGEQEVLFGDLTGQALPQSHPCDIRLKPVPSIPDDDINDSCLMSSDQVPFNSEPMSEAYRKSLYAVRPEFEKKVLVDNIMSKVHKVAGGFLSDHEEEDVKACTTNREKMRSLFKTLRTKSNKDFMTFCEVLESSDYQHFATKLKKAAGIHCKPPKDLSYMMSERVVTRYEEDPTPMVDLEGRHIHKSDVSCDQHRLAENGEQEVLFGDVSGQALPQSHPCDIRLKPVSSTPDDDINNSCLMSSDQVPFNSEPMTEAYRKSLYAVRPEFEKKVLVDNIISKVHKDAGGFLDDHEEEDVMACSTNREKMRSLLKTLRTKSNKDFMTFCEVLESSGYQHFATKLKKAAGINCKPPKDPGRKATHKILKEKKVAYSLHPVIEKLKAPFSTVQGEFRKQVRSLSDDLYDEVVALCQTTMATKAHVSRLPDVPSHDRKDFIDHIIKHTTLFEIDLMHEVANLLEQPTLTEAVVRYEAILKPLMETSIAELTDRCEVMPIDQDSPEGTYQLVLKFPDDANVKDLYEAKDYLEKILRIPDAKLLAFDFGCILAYFEITCTDETLKNFPKKLTKHSDQLKAMGISGASLIDHWAWGADSDGVWYTNDESDGMEVNDQRGFLGNRKRSHLGSVSGECAEIVPSKKAPHLKENCPIKKESGDRQGTAEEDCCIQPPHPPLPCTEEGTSQRSEPVFQTEDLKEELLRRFEQLQTPLLQKKVENFAQRYFMSDDMEVNDQQGFLGNRKRSHLGSVSGGCAEILPSKKGSHLKESCPAEKESGDRQGTAKEDCCSHSTHPLMLHGMWMTLAVNLGVPVMDLTPRRLTPRRLTPRRRWTEQKCILQYKTRSDSVLKEAIVLRNLCGTDGDCRESDCHYQTNLRSSKLLKLSSGGISSTQPALRRLARKRRNRLKAISSSAQSLNCHHRKSQRTIRTSRTSHTSSLPSLAQPQTSSVQSDPTDEVESTRMDQTDSGFSNDQ